MNYKFDAGDRVIVGGASPASPHLRSETAVVLGRKISWGFGDAVPAYDITYESDSQVCWVYETNLTPALTPEQEQSLREGLLELVERSS